MNMVDDSKINEFMVKRNEAQEVVDKFESAIKALKALCDHSWEYEGHGHNYETERCHLCGEIRRV